MSIIHKLLFYPLAFFWAAIPSMSAAVLFCSYFELEQAGIHFHSFFVIAVLLGIYLQKKFTYKSYLDDTGS
jgi:hypothetical protein